MKQFYPRVEVIHHRLRSGIRSGEDQDITAHLGESWVSRSPPYPIIPTSKGTFEPDGPFYESLPAGTR